MKSLALYLIGVSVVASSMAPAVAADQPPEGYAVLSQGVAHERLYSVEFDGDYGVAVGGLGLVKITEDGGATWTRESAPTDLALLAVTLTDERAIAVGQMGLILIRDRNGGEWRKVESGTKERLLRVDANSNGLAYVAGAFGAVLKSTDGGASWASAPPSWEEIAKGHGSGSPGPAELGPSMYAVIVGDDDRVMLAGEIGYILVSSDGGNSWALTHRGVDDPKVIAPSVFDLQIRPDGTGIAVGQSGLVLRTTDGGQSWQELDSPVEDNLFAVSLTSSNNITIAGMRTAIQSADGGASWDLLKGLDLPVGWYVALSARQDAKAKRKLIAVGHSGRIISLPTP